MTAQSEHHTLYNHSVVMASWQLQIYVNLWEMKRLIEILSFVEGQSPLPAETTLRVETYHLLKSYERSLNYCYEHISRS